MEMADDARTAADAIRGTWAALKEWRERVKAAYLPSKDSELALDDDDWPYSPTSAIAWNGLVAATDHLNGIRAHIEGNDLFPMSHLTLCRSALIGSSQTVWVLGSKERPTRQRRTRVVNTALYKKHLQYLRGLQESAEKPHIGTDLVTEHVQQRLNELLAKRAADHQNEDLNYTEMVREAARTAFTQPALVQEVVSAWQSGSGTAHGLPWPLLGTPGTVQTKLADEGGMGQFRAGGSYGRIANAYMSAYYLAEQGWQMLFQQGTASKNWST